MFYSGGVFNSSCGAQVNHGVTAVGYGTDEKSGLDYYIIKNSWGPSWGLDGYIWLWRNSGIKEGQCGVAAHVSYPSDKAE